MATPEIFHLIYQINSQLKPISSPDCTNPHVCRGNCCYTSPDIPRTLAYRYIEEKWASFQDFELSNTLEIRLKINPETKRCVFFDPHINGCKIHHTNFQPPQCSLYPYREKGQIHKCRKDYAFRYDSAQISCIIALFEKYYQLCIAEFNLAISKSSIQNQIHTQLLTELMSCKPSRLEYIKETVAGFELKKSSKLCYNCIEYCNDISCGKDYEDCSQICLPLRNLLEKDVVTFIFDTKSKGQIYDMIPLGAIRKDPLE